MTGLVVKVLAHNDKRLGYGSQAMQINSSSDIQFWGFILLSFPLYPLCGRINWVPSPTSDLIFSFSSLFHCFELMRIPFYECDLCAWRNGRVEGREVVRQVSMVYLFICLFMFLLFVVKMPTFLPKRGLVHFKKKLLYILCPRLYSFLR